MHTHFDKILFTFFGTIICCNTPPGAIVKIFTGSGWASLPPLLRNIIMPKSVNKVLSFNTPEMRILELILQIIYKMGLHWGSQIIGVIPGTLVMAICSNTHRKRTASSLNTARSVLG